MSTDVLVDTQESQGLVIQAVVLVSFHLRSISSKKPAFRFFKKVSVTPGTDTLVNQKAEGCNG